ncbi:GPO family capsid scaffolding protein [Thiothrix unzii]|uniref:GPO family capsid scaffolding protein n=1 Tax=Thiothrix unzii TaxID=111769 RepID=A0A975IGW4_9GAMM|nr:GPO family capsid scaffolding protein [Thiothrix unzii]QTR53119.1 GPO family capsid scaffolding protein [Thiothrix unzii]
MFETDWIIAAVEGETADGRGISKEQVQQMADSYNPQVYAAKIWLEHLRGTLPDSVFKALGTVSGVKADTIKSGELKGKLALFVKLTPSPELIAMVRNGQKTHLSIEMHPEFPTTGGAYLMGLGVTDSPASIGTGIMKFSTTNRPENVFSAPLVCEFGNCENQQDDLTAIRSMLEKLTANPDPWKGKTEPDPTNPPHQFAAHSDLDKLRNDFAELTAKFQKFEDFMAEDVTPVRRELGGRSLENNRIGY